jgi:hypothetical protein
MLLNHLKEYYIGDLAGQSSLGVLAWPHVICYRARPGQLSHDRSRPQEADSLFRPTPAGWKTLKCTV